MMSGLKDLLASIIMDSAWMTCAVALRTVNLVLCSDGRPLPWRCCWIDSRSVQGSSSPVGRQKTREQTHAVLVEICCNQFCAD